MSETKDANRLELNPEEVARRRQAVTQCLMERARADWEKRVVVDGKRYRENHPDTAEMLDKTQAKLVLEGSESRSRPPTDLETVVRAFNFAHCKAIEYIRANPDTTDADIAGVRAYVLDGNENLQTFARDHPRGFALLVQPSFVTNAGQVEMMRNLIINQAMA